MDQNKPIVALCHGIQLLTALGKDTLKGKKFATINHLESEVRNAGIEIAHLKEKHDVFVDGNIITGGPPACIPNALAKYYDLLGVKISLPNE